MARQAAYLLCHLLLWGLVTSCPLLRGWGSSPTGTTSSLSRWMMSFWRRKDKGSWKRSEDVKKLLGSWWQMFWNTWCRERVSKLHPVLCYCSCLVTASFLFCDPADCSPQALCPWDFPGKNTGVGCYSFLQGGFLMQELNLSVLYGHVDSVLLNHQSHPALSVYTQEFSGWMEAERWGVNSNWMPR